MSRLVNAPPAGPAERVTVRDSMGYLPRPPPPRAEKQAPGVDISLSVGGKDAKRQDQVNAGRAVRYVKPWFSRQFTIIRKRFERNNPTQSKEVITVGKVTLVFDPNIVKEEIIIQQYIGISRNVKCLANGEHTMKVRSRM